MLRSKCNEQSSRVVFHGCVIVRNVRDTDLTSHAWCLRSRVWVAVVFVNGAQKRAGLEMVITSREVVYVF